MASSVNLRGSALLNKSPYDDYRIIHHWEAEDWTEGTDWIDRVGGLAFTRVGNPIKANGMIGCCRNIGYFTLNANAVAPNGIDMGSLWIVEVEFQINYDSTLTGEKCQVAVDFGSLNFSPHAFGFIVNEKSKEFNMNPKFNGDPEPYRQIWNFENLYGSIHKAAMGTQEVDSNTVLPFYTLDNEIKYSQNTVTKSQAEFNRNFDKSNVLIGVVNFNGSLDNNFFYKYIKSIKIYSHLSETTTISISQRGGDDSVLTGLSVKVTDTYNGNILYQGTWDGNDITLKIFDRVNYTVEVGTVTDYWVLSTKRQYTAVGGINKTISFDFLYKSVDLGLPSGRIWSIGNLCKDNQGNYYIGEQTERGTYVSWANIDGHNYGEGYNFSQDNYNTTSGASQSGSIASNDAEHDICFARLGSPWRLPTLAEIEELKNNTDYENTTLNCVAGIKIMKKTDHSVFIFLPYHGTCGNTMLYFDNVRYAAWQSSTTHMLYVDQGQSIKWAAMDRRNGLNIRPVM